MMTLIKCFIIWVNFIYKFKLSSMKKSLILIITIFLLSNVYAQFPLSKGQSQLNLGLGLSSKGIPIYGGIDVALNREFTVGGELGIRSFTENTYKQNVVSISANANYHFNEVLEMSNAWDLYAGLSLGFNIWSTSNNNPSTGTSGLGLAAQIGTRFKVSRKLSLNLEFGGGNIFSGGKFGITTPL